MKQKDLFIPLLLREREMLVSWVTRTRAENNKTINFATRACTHDTAFPLLLPLLFSILCPFRARGWSAAVLYDEKDASMISILSVL